MPPEPTLALIGCGAIAESFHLPALSRVPGLAGRLILVDASRERAERMRARFGAAETATDYRDVLRAVDGVLVATPHQYHAPITLDCVRQGKHVLCEKPLAESSADVRAIIEAADAAKAVVAVNNGRRLFPAFRRAREIVTSGELGALRSIDLELGEKFDWPAASNSYFGKPGARRGVVADTGAHVLDLLCWWIGAKPALTEAADDSDGGSEAVAELRAEHEGCRASVRLSWLSKLSNTWRIEGERGAIEGLMYEWKSFERVSANGRRSTEKVPSEMKTFDDFGTLLIGNFLEAIAGRAAPLVSARDIAPSIELIEEFYDARRELPQPWLRAWEKVIRA